MTGSPSSIAPGDAPPPRARTYAAARRHSILVRGLKLGIPAGAVLVCGAITAWSVLNPFGRIPGLTLGPVSISGTKIAMERPRLTGFREKDKRPYEVTATAAFQDIRKPSLIELKDMKARMAVDDAGGMANLRSNAGLFDTAKEHLDLTDDIRAWTDKGEEMLLRSAAVDLKAGAVTSHEPVKLKTPTLTLDAGGMELSDNGKTIVFTGRVRAVLLRGVESGAEGGAKGTVAAASPKAGSTAPNPGSAASRVAEAEAGR